MTMKTGVYLIKKRVNNNPEVKKYLDEIDCAVTSTYSLLQFSQLYNEISAEEPIIIGVAEAFNKAVTVTSKIGNIEIINECTDMQVTADSLLIQLFHDLLDNSLKHGEKVTQIRLCATKNEKEIKLYYEDNGIGISNINKQKIFNTCFTTGNGSSHGLYLIKKIVDVYGWTITEQGTEGKGVKFVISIPIIRKMNLVLDNTV